MYINNNGYYVITSGQHRGRLFHRVIWEECNGLIPKNCSIHHRDENPLNNDIENLKCMSRTDHGRLHHTGKKLTKETKRKISESRIGKKNHMYGKKHTEKSKKKMSEVKFRDKNSMYGKKHTEKQKKRYQKQWQVRNIPCLENDIWTRQNKECP